jgi:hypothetical protein
MAAAKTFYRLFVWPRLGVSDVFISEATSSEFSDGGISRWQRTTFNAGARSNF